MSKLRSLAHKSLGAFLLALLASLWLVQLTPHAAAFHLSFGQRLRKFKASFSN